MSRHSCDVCEIYSPVLLPRVLMQQWSLVSSKLLKRAVRRNANVLSQNITRFQHVIQCVIHS